MKKIRVSRVIIVLSIVLTVGISTGFLANQESRDFRIAKNLDIFFSLFRELNTFYVDTIDPDKLIKSGIDNMLSTLDPYTVYYPANEAEEFTIMTTGKYGGIGSLVRGSGDYAVISEVYKGFPADQAGLKPGDLLIKVDGVSLKGLTTDKISEKLKGNPGTDLILTIERNGKQSDFHIKREKIVMPPVPYYGMLDSKTGYIRLKEFTQNCAVDVKSALSELENNHPQQVILDLRGNPGGLLNEAVDVLNLFIDPGTEVVSTKGKVKQFDEVFKTTKPAVDNKIHLAVLINRGSASASEIVTGAIQDLDRGIIVGQRSYGKGLVQITRPLSYNAELKVTTAKYYIPSGRCIQALDYSHRNPDGSVGIIPDSLISEYKTKDGRIVKDGGGISPDVEVQPESLSQISAELYVRYYIFDYATKYYWAHPDIKSPEQFTFTDQDYADFRKYLISRNFNYKTNTEESLNQLITNAKKEKYYDMHKALFNEMEKDITHNLDQDLTMFRSEITDLIEDEIIGRYFYESGEVAWTIRKDKQVLKARELLDNTQKYDSLLKGETGAIIVRRKNDPNLPKN